MSNEAKIEGLKECKRPGCVNAVPLSRGTKPREYCDDVECKRLRGNSAGVEYRARLRELLRGREAATRGER